MTYSEAMRAARKGLGVRPVGWLRLKVYWDARLDDMVLSGAGVTAPWWRSAWQVAAQWEVSPC